MALPTRALVGRDAELSAIDECLDQTERGRATIALCRGEPGIGKTRLAEELVTRADARGFITAWGIADESVGTPPYWPWTQALRTLTASADVREIARERRLERELARLLPEEFASGDDTRDQVATPDDRFRLFDAVTTVIRSASIIRPIAIVLDDMHWADEESAQLLRHVALSLPGARVLLWASARDGEPADRFRWLRRVPGAVEVQLAGLGAPAVRAQLESLTGAPVSESDATTMWSLTRGNPLLVREAALALAGSGAPTSNPPITAGIQQAVDERLARVAADSQQLLQVAAVIGREFDVGVLAVMTAKTEVACLDLLGEPERAGLVERGGARGHRFVHALVRDAIEHRLSPAARVTLHRAAADALERIHGNEPGAHVFEIARHWAIAATAGERSTAARWLEQAADLAMATLGYEQAARLYEEAVSVGATDIDAARRGDLLLRAAAAMNRSGALGDCHRARMAAVAAAPAALRVAVTAGAALAMDPVGQPGFDLATRRLCEEALAAVGTEPSSLRARLSARFAETFIYLPETDDADRASAEAIAVAEAAEDEAAIVSSLRARQVVVAHPSRLAERSEIADRLVAAGRRTGDASTQLRGHLCRVDAWFERGLLGRIDAELDLASALADETRSPLDRYLVTHTRAVLAQAQGRVSEARRLSDEAIARGGWGDHPDPIHRRVAVLSGIARLDGVDDVSAPVVTMPDGLKPPFIADLAAAHTLATTGRLAEALDLLQSLGPPAQWHPPSHVVLLGAALGLETAIALRRSRDVETLAAQLDPYRGHHVTCGLGAASYLGPVELWIGKAALHSDRPGVAIVELSTAIESSRAAGAAGAELEATADLAFALIANGDVVAAKRLVGAALPTAEQLGLGVVVARLDEASAQPVASRPDPLTAREHEVAALVAQGLSNREIAEHLVVSERTAQNHVQHILTKLGLRNRTQVAHWFASTTER